jgi:hypothetical protein
MTTVSYVTHNKISLLCEERKCGGSTSSVSNLFKYPSGKSDRIGFISAESSIGLWNSWRRGPCGLMTRFGHTAAPTFAASSCCLLSMKTRGLPGGDSAKCRCTSSGVNPPRCHDNAIHGFHYDIDILHGKCDYYVFHRPTKNTGS